MQKLDTPRLRPLQALSLFLNAAGWGVSCYLLYHRQRLLQGAQEAPSFCAISSYINCDVVALSPQSESFGFPTAAWGMFAFACLFVLSLLTLISTTDEQAAERTKKLTSISFVVSLLSIPFIIAKAYAMFVVIKAVCILCLLSYAINLGVLFTNYLSLKTVEVKVGAAFRHLAPPMSLVGIVIALALFHAFMPTIINGAIGDGGQRSDMVDMSVREFFNEAAKPVSPAGAPAWGAPEATAKVTLVEFSDFECPFCARSSINLTPLLKNYADKIRVVFKNYPLDTSCNPEMKHAAHQHACMAAKAAWCVYKAKGDEAFFKFKYALFNNQDKLSPAYVDSLLQEQGHDVAAIATCRADVATHQSIVDQVKEGTAAGVSGTPSIFINGKPFRYGPNPQIMKKVLDELLK